MTLFIDASAAVSMLTLETDADRLLAEADSASRLLWSGIARWEATVAFARKMGKPTPEILSDVEEFARRQAIETVPIGDAETHLALDAFARFGKGSGHPAQLNMGDCFAYACARTNDAKLLYKGDDFSKTDLG